MSVIEQIKEHSLKDYLESQGARLKDTGNGKALTLCGIHEDTNPSLEVSDTHFKCWVCNVRGDIINYVELREKTDTSGAIKKLCADLNIITDRRENAKETSQIMALKFATEVFQSTLNKSVFKDMKAYLHDRGISQKTLEEFQVGFVPVGNYLNTRIKMNKEAHLTLNMVVPDEKGEYDFFRNRIMFPIRNVKGTVVGFGGRINPFESNSKGSFSKPAKYLNSKASDIYNKSEVLYGLFEAIKANGNSKSFDVIYVVEGYMDVIACHEVGIYNVVACCGTHISQEHLRILFKYTDHISFVFDGDEAGRKGSNDALDASLSIMSLQKHVSFVKITDDKDTADFVKEGRIEFLKGKMKLAEGFEKVIERRIRDADAEGLSVFRKNCNRRAKLLQISSVMEAELGKALVRHVEQELNF